MTSSSGDKCIFILSFKTIPDRNVKDYSAIQIRLSSVSSHINCTVLSVRSNCLLEVVKGTAYALLILLKVVQMDAYFISDSGLLPKVKILTAIKKKET